MAAVDTYGTLRRIERAVKALPAVRSWQLRQYEKMFASDAGYGWFRGVFSTFPDAVRSAPTNRAIGFDLPSYARMFDERHTQIFPYDYPVLFWLRSLLSPAARVFDFGGHVGVQFYAYQKYLDFPAGLVWTVCDVPTVASVGRDLAAKRGQSGRLTFTTDVYDAEGYDVFIAAGSLQFVESPSLAEALGALRNPPTNLLLNKIPLRQGEGFVTLQNAGTSFVPQYVFSRQEFTGSLERLGYRVVDAWEDRVHSCNIPFHPDKSVAHYSGLYMTRSPGHATGQRPSESG